MCRNPLRGGGSRITGLRSRTSTNRASPFASAWLKSQIDLDFLRKRDGLVRHGWRGGDLADEDLFGARLNLQTIRLFAADLQFGGLPQCFERGQGVVHRRLRVAFREPPCIRDAGELQHALGNVAHREPDPLGSGLQCDLDGPAAPSDPEGEGGSAPAAALPRTTPSLDLNHVQLGVVNRPSDRRTDLAAPGSSEPCEPVLVPYDARDHEVHPAPGVRHPLDHVHVEHLVLRLREEDVDDLRFADRKTGLDCISECGDLTGKDQTTELRFRGPLRQVPFGPCRAGLAPAPASPLRHQVASSFDFTLSNCFAISSPMWAPRTRSFAGSTSGLCGTTTPASSRPCNAAKSRPPRDGRCPPTP